MCSFFLLLYLWQKRDSSFFKIFHKRNIDVYCSVLSEPRRIKTGIGIHSQHPGCKTACVSISQPNTPGILRKPAWRTGYKSFGRRDLRASHKERFKYCQNTVFLSGSQSHRRHKQFCKEDAENTGERDRNSQKEESVL